MSELKQKAVVKSCDMPPDVADQVTGIAQQALEKFTMEKDVAAYIKKEMDSRHGPTWHCIVGRNFGSYVTHEAKSFIYFYLGPLAFLLFKSG